MNAVTLAVSDAAAHMALVRLAATESHSPERRRQLRSGELRRVRSGVYCTRPGAAPSFRERVVAALMVAPPGAVACGLTAARLWRIDALPRYHADEPLQLLVPRGQRGRLAGCRLSQGDIDEFFVVDRVPVTSPAAAVVGAVAGQPFERVFVALEAALRGPCTRAQLSAELGRHRRLRGGVVMRRALAVAGGASESPLESMARLLWLQAELPPPLQQAVVLDRGVFLARVDFLWPEAMLVVEVDGLAKYVDRSELQREKGRQNRLVAAGYTVLRFTWLDLTRRSDDVVAAVRAVIDGE